MARGSGTTWQVALQRETAGAEEDASRCQKWAIRAPDVGWRRAIADLLDRTHGGGDGGDGVKWGVAHSVFS